MLTTLTFVLGCAALPQQEPQQEPRTPEPLPIPRTLILRRAEDQHIDIDGSLQDWPSLPPIRLDDVRQLSGTAMGAYRSRDDLAARLFALWDDEALYLSAAVLDEWHVPLTDETPRLHQIPPVDALYVLLDPRRDTEGFGADPGRRDDAAVWLADVEGQGNRVVGWDSYRGEAGFLEGAEGAVGRLESQRTTFYEARIPWSSLLPEGEGVHERQVFDVQFVVDDFDEPTDLMPQTRVGWNFGMGPRIDPGLLGSAMLADVDTDDLGDGGFPMPPFPEPEPRSAPPVPPLEEMAELLDDVRDHPPEVVGADTVDPSHAGGAERRDALLQLERLIADFPGLDYLRYQFCIQRRMNRECEGIVQQGLPALWNRGLDLVMADVRAEPPETGYRLHRLPEGGWVVRSRQATFAIDPTGYRVDRELDALLDFVLLTAAWDPARRHDLLTVRLLQSADRRRQVFQHVVTHLPLVSADDVVTVRLDREYTPADLSVRVFGNADDEGRLASSVGYWIRWPDGSDLVVSAQVMDEQHVRTEEPIEALLLSARHPRARIVGQRLGAELVVLDNVLQCVPATGGAGLRATLREAWELQEGLRPGRSLLLAPTESVIIEPRDR